MLAEIATGVIVDSIAAVAKWLRTESTAPHGRRMKQHIELATWFDTFKLDPNSQDLAKLNINQERGEELSRALSTNSVQACIYELLAVRLTDAPEADVEKVRSLFVDAIASNLDEPPSLLAQELFDYYDNAVCDLVGQLSGAKPELYKEIRRDAFSARIAAILGAIDAHVSSLSPSITGEQKRSYINNYRRHVIALHGKIQLPDFERRQRVPIEDLYVAPTIAEGLPAEKLRSQNQKYRNARIGAVINEPGRERPTISLNALAKQLDRTVLLGDPGGGKSTASSWLMYNFAQSPTRRIPFLVILREFRSDDGGHGSIVAHIEHKLASLYQCPPPTGLIDQLLHNGEAIVIFDGLDELIDTSLRSEVTEIVEQFGIEYPLTAIMVTSRVVGYNEARLDDALFRCYQLAGFDESQTAEYVRKWFAQDTTIETAEAERWSQSFMQESAAVTDLRSNPLLLALMCILYNGTGSIPYNRPAIYEQCAELMFRKWDMRRRIQIELRIPNLLDPVLRHVAFWLFKRPDGTATASETELEIELANYLEERGFEAGNDPRDAAKEFIDFCRGRAWVFSDAGTTERGEILYRFTHRTFLEYFAGAYLATTSDTPEELSKKLIGHVAKGEWPVVAELAIQKKDQINDKGAERIVCWMLETRRIKSEKSRGNVLAFLARCMTSIEVPTRVLRDVTRACLEYAFQSKADSIALVELTCVEDERTRIVAEEVSVYIDRHIDASGSGCRIALEIMIGLYDAASEHTLEFRNQLFWEDFTLQLCAKHHDVLFAAMKNDVFFTRSALALGLYKVTELIENDNIFFTQLWMDTRAGIFGGGWVPYWPLLVVNIGESHLADIHTNRLTEFGEYISQRRDTPWFTVAAPSSLTGINWFSGEQPESEIAKRNGETLTPNARLAVAAVICMACELENVFDKTQINVFAQAVPGLDIYISTRYGEIRGELPELNVPERAATVLRGWALQRLNLLTIEPE